MTDVAEKVDDATASSAQPALSALSDTLIILMGRSNLGELAADLIRQGRDPATPAACIQSATTPEQRVTRATLATIAEAADRDGLEPPVVTVIGEVAAMGGEAGSVQLEDPHRSRLESHPADHPLAHIIPGTAVSA